LLLEEYQSWIPGFFTHKLKDFMLPSTNNSLHVIVIILDEEVYYFIFLDRPLEKSLPPNIKESQYQFEDNPG
jgi:hypothetical protein